jgi:hypothetical protein
MAKHRLFIRSRKVEVAREFHGGAGPWENPHVMKTTEIVTSGQDALAKQLLQKAKIDFQLVDLSKGIGASVAARLRGISETPTLRVENGSIKVYVGMEAIAKYIDKLQAPV